MLSDTISKVDKQSLLTIFKDNLGYKNLGRLHHFFWLFYASDLKDTFHFQVLFFLSIFTVSSMELDAESQALIKNIFKKIISN